MLAVIFVCLSTALSKFLSVLSLRILTCHAHVKSGNEIVRRKFHYISTNIADNWQNKMYRPVITVSDHNETIIDMITCVYDSLICTLVPPLLRTLFFTFSRPILHVTAQIRSPDPCFQDHSWINYVCPWHAMQILTCQHDKKCDFTKPILHVSWEAFWGHHQSQTCLSSFSSSSCSSSSRSPVSRRSNIHFDNTGPQDHTHSILSPYQQPPHRLSFMKRPSRWSTSPTIQTAQGRGDIASWRRPRSRSVRSQFSASSLLSGTSLIISLSQTRTGSTPWILVLRPDGIRVRRVPSRSFELTLSDT